LCADVQPRAEVTAHAAAAAPAPTPPPPPQAQPDGTRPPLTLDGESPEPLRGAAARGVENMEASLGVPTATSVRTVPAKLLEVNRQILNNHLGRTGRAKVSFTHLISYAVLKALARVPAMNSPFEFVDGQPNVVRHEHANLGLAVDVEKRDGSPTLLVPNVKRADTLEFRAFHAAYAE